MSRHARQERWGGVLVDAVAVVVLIALTLSLLDESFWSRAYLVAGLVPVVLLVATALVLRRATDGAQLVCARGPRRVRAARRTRGAAASGPVAAADLRDDDPGAG